MILKGKRLTSFSENKRNWSSRLLLNDKTLKTCLFLTRSLKTSLYKYIKNCIKKGKDYNKSTNCQHCRWRDPWSIVHSSLSFDMMAPLTGDCFVRFQTDEDSRRWPGASLLIPLFRKAPGLTRVSGGMCKGQLAAMLPWGRRGQWHSAAVTWPARGHLRSHQLANQVAPASRRASSAYAEYAWASPRNETGEHKLKSRSGAVPLLQILELGCSAPPLKSATCG